MEKRKLSPTGEYTIGDNTLRSAERTREFQLQRSERQEGRTARTGSSKVAYHLIRPKYCAMLGIDPDKMIASLMGKVWRDILDCEIDLNFSSLDEAMPLRERIFEAHVRAYDGGMGKSMQLIRELFF